MLLERERGIEGGEALVSGVLRDIETSALAENEKILLHFIEIVNSHSHEIAAEDLDPVRAAGWSDEAIYYAITVCALFNFYNRWIDATGVHPLSEAAHRTGGVRSAASGYVRK